jgi:hypothetical protein
MEWNVTNLKFVELGDGAEPPRPLGRYGRALWDRVQAEFAITDIDGIELLMQGARPSIAPKNFRPRSPRSRSAL